MIRAPLRDLPNLDVMTGYAAGSQNETDLKSFFNRLPDSDYDDRYGPPYGNAYGYHRTRDGRAFAQTAAATEEIARQIADVQQATSRSLNAITTIDRTIQASYSWTSSANIVAGLIKQTPGTVGYVELVYALENKLAFAQIQNKAGKFVDASAMSVSAAGSPVTCVLDTSMRISGCAAWNA